MAAMMLMTTLGFGSGSCSFGIRTWQNAVWNIGIFITVHIHVHVHIHVQSQALEQTLRMGAWYGRTSLGALATRWPSSLALCSLFLPMPLYSSSVRIWISTLRRVGMTKAGFSPLSRPMMHMASSRIRNTCSNEAMSSADCVYPPPPTHPVMQTVYTPPRLTPSCRLCIPPLDSPRHADCVYPPSTHPVMQTVYTPPRLTPSCRLCIPPLDSPRHADCVYPPPSTHPVM